MQTPIPIDIFGEMKQIKSFEVKADNGTSKL